MIQQFLVKLLLSPFALLYSIGIGLRDLLYNIKFFKSISYNFPIISIGNLSVGGTGKTPQVEYLIKELQPFIRVGVLSRGYSRKTKGFFYVNPQSDANSVGDEPLQIKRKFPDSVVAVVENRALGIPQLLKSRPDLKVIILDDGFQHRPIRPGLNILLTDYNSMFTQDYLLPVGRLREFRSAYQRADFIVVTKTPNLLGEEQRHQLIDDIKPTPNQKVFFSYFSYLHPYNIWNPQNSIVLNKSLKVILISAIANTDYLLSYIEDKVNFVRSFEFEDHHFFSNSEVGNLKKHFNEMEGTNKIILTTEKDATRLDLHKSYLMTEKLPIFVLPIQITFHQTTQKTFIDEVKSFLLDFKV